MQREKNALNGVGVLVTRPLKQARLFAKRLEQFGAVPVVFPTIEIAPPQDMQPLLEARKCLGTYDFVMFVSANAVEQALAALTRWPENVIALAPGKETAGTAAALRQAGVPDQTILTPVSRFDSEGLLELSALQQMQGKRVLILRGERGRELLGETLAARGADVTRVTCYRRVCPEGDAEFLWPLLRQNRLQAITLTAGEALDNLEAMAGEALGQALKALPVFTIHPRIAAHAQARGWKAIDTSRSDSSGGDNSDEGLICGMDSFFSVSRAE
ncbi:MAG: uroporphyrinogen-III synthase [Burkholderiales bacterium]|jgi:uroporphyrinogen-III synthase|nr:uroporphyrinogen-III synthase [Burkholderiales bacterium]